MIIDNNYKVIPNTKNGVMDNFKINGNTLVNMWGSKISDFTITSPANFNEVSKCIECTTTSGVFYNFFTNNLSSFKPNTEYTLICNIIESTLLPTDAVWVNGKGTYADSVFNDDWKMVNVVKGIQIKKMTTKLSFDENKDKLTGIRSYIHNISGTVGSKVKLQLIVLEGDYTQNPPSYFEGLKSVGDGEKLEVLTVNENLASKDNILKDIYVDVTTKTFKKSIGTRSVTFKVGKNSEYIVNFDKEVNRNVYALTNDYPKEGNACDYTGIGLEITPQKAFRFNSGDYGYATFYYNNVDIEVDVNINNGSVPKPYIEHKSSKQQIEYYPNRGSLFDVSKIPVSTSNSSIDLLIESNVITVKGKLQSNVEAFTDLETMEACIYLEKDKKYTFEFKSDATFGGIAGADTVEMFWFLDGVSTGSNVVMLNVQGKATITCTKTGMYYPRFDVNKGDATHKFWDIFVSEGDTYNPIGSGQLTPVIARKLSDTIRDTVDTSEGIYTKKCEQRIFKGSSDENWSVATSETTDINIRVAVTNAGMKGNRSILFSNKYKFKTNTSNTEEGMFTSVAGSTVFIDILKSKCPSLEVFKQQLASDNLALVYELEQEKVYECTKFYPSTFDTETTFSSNSIVPTTYETDLVSGLVDMTRISNEQSKNLASQKDKLSNILKGKNIEVLESDKLQNLINKVDNNLIITPTMKRRGFIMESDVLPLPSRTVDNMTILSMYANNNTLITTVNNTTGRIFDLKNGTYSQVEFPVSNGGSTVYYKPRANSDIQYMQRSNDFWNITLPTLTKSALKNPNSLSNSIVSSLEDNSQIYAFQSGSQQYLQAYKYDSSNDTWVTKAKYDTSQADIACYYSKACAVPGGFLLLGHNDNSSKLNLYKYEISADTFSLIGYWGIEVETYSTTYKSIGVYKNNKCTWFVNKQILNYDMTTGIFSIVSETQYDFCIRTENQIFINSEGTETGLSEITFLK